MCKSQFCVRGCSGYPVLKFLQTASSHPVDMHFERLTHLQPFKLPDRPITLSRKFFVDLQSEINGLRVERRTYFNQACKTFHRVILTIPDMEVAFLQYYFLGAETSFTVPRHGNRTSSWSPHKKQCASSRIEVHKGISDGN